LSQHREEHDSAEYRAGSKPLGRIGHSAARAKTMTGSTASRIMAWLDGNRLSPNVKRVIGARVVITPI
jgi:hypothetical protein